MRAFVQILLAILLVGIGGAGGWYLRGLAEFSRGADTATFSTHDDANNPTESASTGKPYDHETLDRLLSTTQYAEAIELFRTLMFDKGFTPIGWASDLFLFHTQRLERLGATHKAIRLLQEYLAVASQDADAYILLAHLQHRKGRTGAALETLVSASITVRSERQAQLPNISWPYPPLPLPTSKRWRQDRRRRWQWRRLRYCRYRRWMRGLSREPGRR